MTVIASEAMQSRASHGTLDCFVASRLRSSSYGGQIARRKDVVETCAASPRREIAPRALLDIAPERQRAECRVLAAPMARQQTKKLAAVTTGSAKLSPGTGLYCLRHCAVRHRTTWCQRRGTRTTRFRRPRRHRSSAHTRYARHRVHRIPAPRIVTISRNARSWRAWDGAYHASDFWKSQAASQNQNQLR